MPYVGFDGRDTPDIIIVCGPTAVGKSAWAINKAQELDGEIISADAYQVYRGMDIGTAKVSSEELAAVPHHLIDCLDPQDPYSVADFLDRVGPIIDAIRSRSKRPIICGGTAFYLNAFLYGYELDDRGVNPDLQKTLLAQVDSEGLGSLVTQLLAQEPACEQWMDLSNPRRVVRALVQLDAGISPSKAAQSRLPFRPDVSCVGLSMDRDKLRDRIDRRVDEMIALGLVAEVKDLLSRGVDPTCPAFQGIGYKEVVAHLSGRLSYADMVDCIKVKTRQFAKRQMTWFRRFEQVTWYDMD